MNTPNFPTAIAGETQMGRAYDLAITTLSADIGSTDLSATVADASRFGANCIITLGSGATSEETVIASIAGNVLTLATGERGFNATTAQSWPAGTQIRANETSYHHNQLVAEINALETALGATLGNIVLPTRQVATDGTTLTGGGNLSADLTLSQLADSINQRVGVAKNSAAVSSTRKTLNVIEGAGITATLADDSANNRANLTLAVAANTTNQQVAVSKGGTAVGTRKQINLIEGTAVTLTVADNSGADRVDVTIAAGGGPSAQADVTGSRALGTVYQNTSGKMLYVSVMCSFTIGTTTITAYCDSSSTPTTVVSQQAPAYGSGTMVTNVFFLVPVGYYYKCSYSSGTVALTHWIEWA